MKAKRFIYQQIRNQKKSIESEDSSSSYEGRYLVGEIEINESHQIGNLLLKISKQKGTIINLSEQLRSILSQYEVLKEELDLLLYLSQVSTSQEKKFISVLEPSSQVVSMQIENPEYQQPLPQVYQQQISSIQEDKNKGISERLEKTEKILIKRQKSKQSEKDTDIVNQHSTQLEIVKILKKFKQEKKKDVKTDLRTLNKKRRNLQEKKFLMSNQEREQASQTSQKNVVKPCHVKLNGPPRSG